MFFPIWQRSWLKTLTLTFFFQLAVFYFLFVLVDLATNSSGFVLRSYTSLSSLGIYYLYQFLRYLDLFLPLCFLLSTIYLLTDKRNHGEICALQMAGISQKALLYPFFLFAAFLAVCLYFNYEKGLPSSLAYTQSFQRQFAKMPHKKKKQSLFVHYLEDGSKLIFQNYDEKAEKISNAFWIYDPNEIWHIQSIFTKDQKIGNFADQFVRNASGYFEKKESLETLVLPPFTLKESFFFLPVEFKPLSILYSQAKNSALLFEEEIVQLYTYLYLRLIMPSLFFLIPLACFPLCVSYQRKKYTFRIYALGLFSFILFQTLLGSMVVLSENSVFSPFACIVVPFLVCYTIVLLFPFLRKTFYQFFFEKKSLPFYLLKETKKAI